MVKGIVAIAGDEVELGESWVAVNGTIIDRTPLRAVDTLGRPLSHFPLGRWVVGPGEVWVLGSLRERSWDSRYFGPVPVDGIVATVHPLLTFGSP